MMRWAALLYWAFSFFASVIALLYLVGFVLNRYAFSTIDSGLQIPEREAVVVNLALLALFGAQHSGMARRWFKRWIPAPIERATYLLATAAVLGFLFYRWEPMPNPVWFTRTRWPFQLLLTLAGLLVAWSVAAQGALHFFGFHQARVRGHAPPPFREKGPYRCLRHPMMIGVAIFLWSTHDMTRGHLLFAAVMTLYIVLGTRWEQRDQSNSAAACSRAPLGRV